MEKEESNKLNFSDVEIVPCKVSNGCDHCIFNGGSIPCTEPDLFQDHFGGCGANNFIYKLKEKPDPFKAFQQSLKNIASEASLFNKEIAKIAKIRKNQKLIIIKKEELEKLTINDVEIVNNRSCENCIFSVPLGCREPENFKSYFGDCFRHHFSYKLKEKPNRFQVLHQIILDDLKKKQEMCKVIETGKLAGITKPEFESLFKYLKFFNKRVRAVLDWEYNPIKSEKLNGLKCIENALGNSKKINLDNLFLSFEYTNNYITKYALEKLKETIKSLNTKNMNNLQIKIPDGHEIDLENTNLAECKVVFKKVKRGLPNGVAYLPKLNEYSYIMDDGTIEVIKNAMDSSDLNTIERKSTAEAFLALMQLIRLRDYANEGWFPDWSEKDQNYKYVIRKFRNSIETESFCNMSCVLIFKSREIRDQFLEKYRDLIETAKELI